MPSPDIVDRSSKADFLTGGSKTAALIRAHDWSATPLGPISDWPSCLRTVVAVVVRSPAPMALLWGADGVMLYNDAYRVIAGERHPSLLGTKVREAWPEVADWNGRIMRSVLAGESLQYKSQALTLERNGRPESAFFDLSYSPVIDESGTPAGVIAVVSETTERVCAERRLAFRLSLEERLRDVTDPDEAIAASSEALGRHLGVAQVAYAEVEAEGETVIIEREWNTGAMAANRRRHRLADYGPDLIRDLKRGATVTIADVALDPRTSSAQATAAFAKAKIAGLLNVPVVKAGTLAAILGVHSDAPHVWTSEEIALAQDIAERTWEAAERATAERALRESEAQLRLSVGAAERRAAELHAVLESMPDAVYIGAAEGITLANQTALDQLGFASRDQLNRHVATLADEIQTRDADTGAFIPIEEQAFTRAFGGEHVVQDVRVRHRLTGEDRVVRCAAAPVEVEGRVIAAVAVNTDITDRRRAEEKLRELNQTLESRVAARTAELVESERRFRGIFDSAFQFMALLAPDGTVQEVNQTALDWSEIEPDEIVGKPFWQAAPMRNNPELQAAIEAGVRRAASGETVRAEHEMQGAGDVRAIVDFSLKPVPGAHGEPAWLVAEGRDITELKRAQDALRQSQKMEAVGQLTGGIAHDFNNLLGAVVGALDLIRRKPDDLAKVKKYAEAGLQAAERGAKLTGQLLAFSRSQRLELKPLVVSELVTGMRDLLSRTLGPMVPLRLELGADGAVLSDPTQLEMAVLNLAINARDAMPDGGDLTITTAMHRMVNDAELKAGDYVELAISDTGTGMPPDVAARAFDPFFTTKGIGKGTGLGLSQVYGLARQAGGTVRIDTRLGVGTSVRLYLPRTDLAVRPDAPEGVDEKSRKPAVARILVVDDDPDVRRMIVASLEALGHHTLEAADGLSGLGLVETEKLDLLMVDFAMPGMSGAEVARIAKERRPDLPIVFASGYADTAAIEAAAGRDAAVLRKPFRVDDLQAVLAEALPGSD